MKRIQAILVDDEKDSREVLAMLLKAHFPEIEITGEASNVEDAYRIITVKQPQLVFLDIQMPGVNGFNLLKKFTDVPFEVIFVTSYDQYAINAIKFNALDYLLKPVEILDLKYAVTKAALTIERKNSSSALVLNLLNSIVPSSTDKKIVVHAGEKVKLLNFSDIICIDADGRYCQITTANDETYTVAKYLKDFEDYLSTDPLFIRISKGLIINIHHIKEYSKGEPCMIEMVNQKTFEVARRKKQEILEKLKKMNNY